MSSVSVPLPLTRPAVSDLAHRWRHRLLVAYVAVLPVMVVHDAPLVGSKVQLTELVFLALLAVVVVAAIRDGRGLAWTPLAPCLGLWLGLGAVSALRALHPRDSAFELAAWGYLAALAVVIAGSIESWEDWRQVVVVWVAASAITAGLVAIGALAGMLWGLHTPFAILVDKLSVIRSPFWVGVGLLWASTTPNMVVGYLLAGSMLALGLTWTARTPRARWLAGIAVGVHALAFGLTISRLAIAVGFAFLVFLLRFRSYGAEVLRWLVLVAWLALVAVVETVSFYQPAAVTVSTSEVRGPDAAGYRTEHYWHLQPDAPVHRLQIETVYAPFARPLLAGAALTLWKERPWLGIGPGGFAREVFERQQTRGERWNGLLVLKPWDPHSTYLGALAEIGLLGTLAVLIVLAVLVWQTIQALRQVTEPALAPLLWAVLACVAGYLVAAVDDDMLTKRWLWGVAGLAGSAWLLARRGADARTA